jgi:anti-anti-sigma factor
MAHLERTELDGVTVLRLAGSLGREQIAEIEKPFYAATDGGNAAIILDLTDVDFLTTPAIAMFVGAACSMRRGGGRIVVSGSQPHVEDVLRRLRLDTLLPRVRSLRDGVARVKNANGVAH